ncbi:MAG: hypothetical protein BWY09_01147 [Candidatus Hydrogenedentes bacterium ADurb.Bin179]|nr:MAG: hypothetical protein BWY09_01147 [Candidatus Hydrogenedentes bacterium ADurb.Bin179]
MALTSEFLTSIEFWRGSLENSIAQKFDTKCRKEGTDYQIANIEHRIVRCIQGLFGSQSLIYSVYGFSQKVPSLIPRSSGSLVRLGKVAYSCGCKSRPGKVAAAG